ncbi:S24 family peptidase [Herminiimonas sp. CN]|uniref:S24 family peptidase n=1 Tax=Herminiimonas sp. CN TaxID=1349818 RepID=UPI00138DE1BE|nr:S24 family peptidase [Herminiimonas sp. CN]
MEIKQIIAGWIKSARTEAGLSGEQLGAKISLELGVSRGHSRANISHWETGKHEPSLQQLLAISKITGKKLPPGIIGSPNGENISNITAIHPDDAPQDDVVYVPESKIAFSAGNGRTATFELIEDQEPATYRLSWFQKEGMNPDRVRRFRVSGDSMEPMLFARDTILVNQDETTIVDGNTYAIRYGDELRVKRIFKRLDGTLILHSINPMYKDEEVSPDLANEHIAVIGRVRDKSGRGGL